MNKISAYLAAPLFTAAERAFNARLERALVEEGRSRGLEIATTIPQRKALERFQESSGTFDVAGIVQDCVVDSCGNHVIIVNLDGSDSDSGTCVEYGLALGGRRFGSHLAGNGQLPDEHCKSKRSVRQVHGARGSGRTKRARGSARAGAGAQTGT